MSGLIDGLNLSEKQAEIMALIDRAEKITPGEFYQQLEDLDLGENAQFIKDFVEISGSCEEVLNKLRKIAQNIKNDQFKKGIDELSKVAEILKKMGVEEKYFKLDMLIVRGLDYYTGTVFETNLNDFKEIGSVSSGGRYENLSEYYSKEKLPGVGASIGLTRLFWSLRDLGLLSFSKRSNAEFLIIPFSENELEKSFKIANELREFGKNVEVLLEEFNMKKAFKFANKRGVKYVLVIGEQEISKNVFEFKNMETGEKLNLNEIIKK